MLFRSGGYKRSITFAMPHEEQEERCKESDHPFSIDTIDLLRPPGFVGKVTNWINSQCLFPREHLAAAAAISTIGNIAGLRYTDDLSSVTANLFVFGVAASGTGKEAIMTAMMDLHIAAGVSAAVHGAIKSEQEIIRNLLRHQMAGLPHVRGGVSMATVRLSDVKWSSPRPWGCFLKEDA